MKKKTSKKKTTKKERRQIDKVDILMLGIIALLGIVILITGVKLIKNVVKSNNEVKANILIPVLEKKSSSRIILTMSEFNKDSKYIFKVNNYRNNNVNKEAIDYKIFINNEDETDLIITKNDSNTNLFKEGKQFEIDNNKLKSKKKQTDIYTVKINSKKNITKDSKVIISVES